MRDSDNTGDEPGGQAVVELLFVVLERPLCHDLEVEYEHDHHAILVLHWHHIHHTQEAVACVGREEDGAQVGSVCCTTLRVDAALERGVNSPALVRLSVRSRQSIAQRIKIALTESMSC